jgi:hypothetical protein
VAIHFEAASSEISLHKQINYVEVPPKKCFSVKIAKEKNFNSIYKLEKTNGRGKHFLAVNFLPLVFALLYNMEYFSKLKASLPQFTIKIHKY